MQKNYFIEALFILLGLGLVAAIIRYPKAVFVTIPLYILSIPFRPLLNLFGLWSTEKEDIEYKSNKNLKVDFEEGEKYIYAFDPTKDLKVLLMDSIEIITEGYAIDDFKMITRGDQTIVEVPKEISFYDYHLIVQHITHEPGEKKSFGVYKSDKLTYYVFQDPNTVNNLVGFTGDRKLFSISMYDDLDEKRVLKLNQGLEVDVEWVIRKTLQTDL